MVVRLVVSLGRLVAIDWGSRGVGAIGIVLGGRGVTSRGVMLGGWGVAIYRGSRGHWIGGLGGIVRGGHV